MEDIVAAVMHVAAIMRDISNASDAQSTDIQEVNRAISTMDEITHQNAALVEQAAAAAQSMQDQAGILMHAVATFRLEYQASTPGEGLDSYADGAMLQNGAAAAQKLHNLKLNVHA